MKNTLIACTLVALAAPGIALAQAADTRPKAAAPAKVAAKPAATADAAARKVKPKPRPKIARSAAKAVEEVTPVSEDTNVTLSEADLAVAQRVHSGPIKCELGANVEITPDANKPGFFTVRTAKVRYRMHPVDSRTGAIRLEDPRAGAMWLQLGNKSMLMSQKLGERLADECQSPQQTAMAEEMKKRPQRSLLDPAEPARTDGAEAAK
ncbi:hypothetical protein [Xylophilus ampelinus]|uniref:Uncharacterized protein n=1 Tax=Xylophilus ampelinus TaxID=54067 RepID=A0A318SJI7_9BURK|nr:hypothetical protein [Xylophilus ampelinus]MCS4509854.1 hypothetical protein [Xylophilus ampelinus]PYE78595.1 hypothetical protein DFQ15_106103 [Xylophilus ampelinus]